MSPTATLLRNDLRWVGPLGLLGLLGHLAAMVSDGPGSLWIFPEGAWGAMNITYFACAGGVLGLAAVLVEELTRTREYLLHRPLSHARIFWTRQALLLAVLTAWLVVPPALHLLGLTIFSRNAALVDESRLLLRIFEGFPVFLFYSVAIFAASATRTWWGGVLLTLTIGVTAWAFVLTGVFVSANSPTGIAVLLATIVLTPLLLAAAFRCQRQGRDSDRPWSASRLRLAGPTLFLTACLVGSGVLTGLHALGAVGVHDLYPGVAQYGSEYVLRRWDNDENTHKQIDRQHRWGQALDEDKLRPLPGADDGPWEELLAGHYRQSIFPRGGTWFRGKLYARVGSWRGRNYYAGSDGYLHVYNRIDRRAQEQGERPWARSIGKGPQQLPFSPRARILAEYHDNIAVFFDPADGGLWVYDLNGDAPSFVRRDLPGGDRFVSVYLHREVVVVDNRIMRPSNALAVRGERGRYTLEDGGWQVIPPDKAGETPPPNLEVARRYERASRFHLSLTQPDGKEVFSHHFRPHTWLERAAEVTAEAPTLLRPPVATLGGLFTTPEKAYQPGGWLFLDPAVTLGARVPLAANLVLTLLLAAYTFRRLGRLGVGPGRRTFWVVAVMLGGFPGFLCARLIETDRAWRPMVKAPEAKPAKAPLLLAA